MLHAIVGWLGDWSAFFIIQRGSWPGIGREKHLKMAKHHLEERVDLSFLASIIGKQSSA
jgi:hypothetical protein